MLFSALGLPRSLMSTVVVVVFGILVVAATQGAPREAALQAAPEAAIDRAKATLAQQLAVSADLVELVDSVQTEWRDSSLGCAMSGVAYAPVLTAGYRVTLRVRRDQFVVHATADRAVVCGKPPVSGTDANEVKMPPAEAVAGLRLSERARQDLARDLGVASERVTVSFFKRMMWPDAGLGCLLDDQVFRPQPTRGFLIELVADGKTYEYHSDMNRVVACPVPAKASGSSNRR